MNEETVQLLEKLAEKLGTTVEYLWEVLVHQALVNSVLLILLMVATVIMGIVLYKLHIRFSKMQPETDKYYAKSLYDREEGYVAMMIIFVFIWTVLLFVSIFSFASMITGFINPEYWALQRILNIVN